MSLMDLENHCSEQATAIQSLAAYCRAQLSADHNLRDPLASGEDTPELQSILPPDAPREFYRIIRSIHAHPNQFQCLLLHPGDYGATFLCN